MSEKLKSKNIEQLMAEADELIQKINSEHIKNMKEEHRLKVDKHSQNLKKIKTEVQGKIEKKGKAKIGSVADGMHEAIQEIVKEMGNLAKYLT
jgi:hypothetical protein